MKTLAMLKHIVGAYDVQPKSITDALIRDFEAGKYPAEKILEEVASMFDEIKDSEVSVFDYVIIGEISARLEEMFRHHLNGLWANIEGEEIPALTKFIQDQIDYDRLAKYFAKEAGII